MNGKVAKPGEEGNTGGIIGSRGRWRDEVVITPYRGKYHVT